jgi:glutamate-ammonia-ligase adenylyltransferase
MTAREALGRYGFADPAAASQHVQKLGEGDHARELQTVLPPLLLGLSESADPDRGLVRFERFLRAHPEPQGLLAALGQRPRALEVLAVTLGGSPFLAETLIRHPVWFDALSDAEALRHPRSRAEIELDLVQSLHALSEHARHEGELQALRLVKRRELLRIGARDLLRLATVEQTLADLSALAEALVQQAYERSDASLRKKQALPPLRSAHAGSGFTVLGLGKLGGGELNFSSDVDLVYLYASDRGRTSRRRRAPLKADFAQQLARRLTAALADTTAEGIVYRVDLRLRPEGRSGAVAGSLASCERYYRARGATWERLALLKARPVAGDRELGALFQQRVRSFVFDRPFGHDAVRDVLRMKHASDRRVAEHGESQRDVKLGAGGIREIELCVQALQVRHGRRHGALHVRGTLEALQAERELQLLPSPEADSLRRAYLFLRDVENKLQMVGDAQVHALPRGHEELRLLARRLGYRDAAGVAADEALQRAHRGHTEAVHRIFTDVFARLERSA